MTQVLLCLYKSWPCDDLDTSYSKDANAFELEKLLKCYSKEKSCWKWAVRLYINDYENYGPKGLLCTHPEAIYIHAYNHNIQTSSLLKPLGQSNPNFIGSILTKVNPIYIYI